MKFDITRRMEVVDQAIAAEDNLFHKAILRNYRRHAHLEVCCMWDQILLPELTCANPHYKIHNGEKVVIANGLSAVGQVYKRMADSNSTVIYHTDEHIMVSDEGFMSEYVSHRFWKGADLARVAGEKLDDLDAHYIVSQTLVTFFTYDSDAILTGEYVYHGADRQVRLCPPDEVISLDECRARLLPLVESAEAIRFHRAAPTMAA